MELNFPLAALQQWLSRAEMQELSLANCRAMSMEQHSSASPRSAQLLEGVFSLQAGG